MFAFLFTITLASAVSINAGECTILDIQIEEEVTWNEVEGIYITQNNSEIEICLDILFESTNFTLEFNVDGEPTIVYRNSGGGGGTTYRDRNVTEYITTEVEVPGDTITNEIKVEVPGETIVKRSIWGWIFSIVLGIAFIYFLFFKNTSEREVQKYE